MPAVKPKLQWIKTTDRRFIKSGINEMLNKTFPTENSSEVRAFSRCRDGRLLW